MKRIISYILIIISFNALADEKSLYEFKWLDEGETVYVIQNKEHEKTGSIGFDLSFVDSASSPYQDTTGLSFGLTYYFSETFSMDFTYKQYNNSDNGDMDNLLSALLAEGEQEVKPIIRKIDTAKLIHFNWIPFYGKVNTFNRIFFFDWGLGVGFGQFDTQGNWETFDQTNTSITYKKDVDTGFNIKSYVKFFTRGNITLGFEYNLTGVDTIKDPNGKKAVLYYSDIIGSIGYIF
jgi:outer membrane beta-barrel protein